MANISQEQIRIIDEICDAYEVFLGLEDMEEEEIVRKINNTSKIIVDNWDTLMKPMNKSVSKHIQTAQKRVGTDWEDLLIDRPRNSKDQLLILLTFIIQQLGDCPFVDYDEHNTDIHTEAYNLNSEELSKCELWCGFQE